MREFINRLKSCWWIIRKGLPSVAFKIDPDDSFRVPDFQLTGPICLYVEGGQMTGSISFGGGPKPEMMMPDGVSFEMVEGPFVVGARTIEIGDTNA